MEQLGKNRDLDRIARRNRVRIEREMKKIRISGDENGARRKKGYKREKTGEVLAERERDGFEEEKTRGHSQPFQWAVPNSGFCFFVFFFLINILILNKNKYFFFLS